jgi:hypothetical protein
MGRPNLADGSFPEEHQLDAAARLDDIPCIRHFCAIPSCWQSAALVIGQRRRLVMVDARVKDNELFKALGDVSPGVT